MLASSLILALLLDFSFKEPKRYHPLVYFGRYADYIEQCFNHEQATRFSGFLAGMILLLPLLLFFLILSMLTNSYPILNVLLGGLFLYLAMGWQSLLQHAGKVVEPLNKKNIVEARLAVAMLVSRDTDSIGEVEIAKATTESILENGADAIFSAIFWYCLFGIPGVVFYRLANTLDAMWGYKNSRFVKFGWFVARLDDVLNFVPARLTAFSYALLGHSGNAFKCWYRQARQWKSPNAGPVMASGAGALNVSLGGAASYHGQVQSRPLLGPEESSATMASASSISEACSLVNRTLLLWLLVIALLSILY